MARCRLYLITPAALDPTLFRDRLAAALDAGDVAAVQLRLKDADDGAWHAAIDELRPVAQSRGVAFLLNDRPELVRKTGCDGVHVGQSDTPAREARALIGDAMLGGDLPRQPGPGDGRRRRRRGLRRVRGVFPQCEQGGHEAGRSGNPDLVVGNDGAALLCDSAASRRRIAACW